MKTIKFSRNWNGKLNNRVFSTIRKDRDGYYQSKEGDIFNVVHNNSVIFTARLVSARSMPFKDIPNELLTLDTGRTDFKEAMGIFQTFYGAGFNTADKFNILIFERLDKKEAA